MAAFAKDNVSYRLLNRLSNLVICSRFSGRHSLTNECAECRARNPAKHGHRRKLGKLLTLRR
jgi:hypothetical protein